MGLLADVTPNTPILSTWGNTVRNQSIMPFTNAAERASQWIAPPEGALSFLRDTDTTSYYDGAAWRGIAYGEVAQVSGTASTGGFVQAVSPIPGMTLTYTATAGRIYQVCFNCLIAVSGVAALLCIFQDGVQIQQRNFVNDQGVHLVARVTAAAGAHTWDVRGGKASAVGTVTILAGATFPWNFWIADMGPVTP